VEHHLVEQVAELVLEPGVGVVVRVAGRGVGREPFDRLDGLVGLLEEVAGE
jgi:hypothetical protein